MTKKKTVEAFADCLQLMDLAIERGGIRVPYPTARKAISMRHRIYRARQTHFNATEAPTYNDVYIQLVQNDKVLGPGTLENPDEPCAIVIRLHSKRELPMLEDLDGNPITLTPADREARKADPLDDAVADFARNLGLRTNDQ